MKFLNSVNEVINATEPDGTQVHVVMDNYATHKAPRVKRWLRQPGVPRALHADGRELAEPGWAELRRPDEQSFAAAFTSLASLEKAIRSYLDERNADAKPFARTAKADLILGRVKRPCLRIAGTGH